MSWSLVEIFLENAMPPQFVGWRDARGTAFAAVRYIDATGEVATMPLPPRRDLRDHSPAGFEWGYLGSGPSQLALAIAAFVLEDDAAATACYQWLKQELIAPLDRDKPWLLDVEEVRRFAMLHPART